MKRKIYEVKQSSEKDCAPACLLSIIKYYKGYVNLEKIKIDAKTSMSGTTAYDLIKASNSYGFDAAGLKLEKENLLSENRFYPFIAQVNIRKYEHFVVVYEVNKKNVVLMDPAYGKKVINISEFLEISTGIIIEFYPRNEIMIMKKNSALLDLFIKVVKIEKKLLIKIVFTSILLTICTIVSSFYFKVGVENVTSDLELLKYVVVFFMIITIFKVVFHKVRATYQTHLNKNLLVRLYQEFFEHLFSLPSKRLENKSLGEIVTRINDLGNIKNVFSEIIVSVFLDFILTLIAVPLLIYINSYLFIILFCMLILYLIIGIVFSKFLYRKIVENKEYETVFNTNIIESVTMFKNIKNLGKTKNVLKKIEHSISDYIYSTFKIELFYTEESNLKNVVNECGYFLINTVGIYLIYQNKITVTDLITFNTLTSFFLSPIQNLINNIHKYSFIRASIYKLNEFMSLKNDEENEKTALEKYDIKFKNVTFGYNDFDNVLNNVSFNIFENEHVFIKGKSGGGKSTACKLLIKNQSYTEGEILFGGHNVNDLSGESLRDNILYISQKEYLFTDTIKENILFFNDYNIEKFSKICELCKVNEILKTKKLKFDSFIEMDANNFSGGEKQRIILARACLNDFKVLIIDEALSEVDYFTEVDIINNLKKYFKNKTIIYISHKKLDKYFKRVINIEKS